MIFILSILSIINIKTKMLRYYGKLVYIILLSLNVNEKTDDLIIFNKI